jgi:hypothetical protein
MSYRYRARILLGRIKAGALTDDPVKVLGEPRTPDECRELAEVVYAYGVKVLHWTRRNAHLAKMQWVRQQAAARGRFDWQMKD